MQNFVCIREFFYCHQCDRWQVLEIVIPVNVLVKGILTRYLSLSKYLLMDFIWRGEQRLPWTYRFQNKTSFSEWGEERWTRKNCYEPSDNPFEFGKLDQVRSSEIWPEKKHYIIPGKFRPWPDFAVQIFSWPDFAV